MLHTRDSVASSSVQDRFRWATLEAEKARSRADEAEVQLQVQAGAVRSIRCQRSKIGLQA
jgi:hypothetical protein